MPSTTALAIITGAFETLGVYAPGESLSPADQNGALRRLNLLMEGLSLQPLTQPVLARDVFDLVADKGGPDNPYTIGTGGDFDVPRPITLEGAGILLVQPDPTNNVEVPRALLTDDAWAAIQIKTLSATQFTDVYYNPTYANDLGTINLWPIPNIATNKLVVYRRQLLTAFATAVTSYDLPPGCAEMLWYQLAQRLAPVYGVTDAGIVGDVRDMARTTLATFKRANTELADLSTDPALTRDPSGGYNILTGTGGGSANG